MTKEPTPTVLCANPSVYYEGTRRARCQAAVHRDSGWRQCRRAVLSRWDKTASIYALCRVHARHERLAPMLQTVEVHKET